MDHEWMDGLRHFMYVVFIILRKATLSPNIGDSLFFFTNCDLNVSQ